MPPTIAPSTPPGAADGAPPGAPSAAPGAPPPRGRRRVALTVAAALAAAVALVLVGRLGGRYVPEFASGCAGWARGGRRVRRRLRARHGGRASRLAAHARGRRHLRLWAGTLWVFVGRHARRVGGVPRRALRGPRARGAAGARDPRFQAIDRAIAADGRRIVFLLGLSPAVPFSLLNYLLGLTRVRFADFVVASVGMLPGTLLYVYTGKLAGDVAAAAGGGGPARGAGYYVVLALGLAATVAVTVVVTRAARRALRAAEGLGAGALGGAS
jgi:hypothetical protein